MDDQSFRLGDHGRYLACSMFEWLKNTKKCERSILLAEPFPRPWQELLHERVWQYQFLTFSQRCRFHNCAKVLVGETHWRGVDGHQVNEDMKITISGHASLTLLGFENDFMDEIRTINVHRREFDDKQESDTQTGRACIDGTTVLSWHHVLNADYYGGHNLVVHEFAHHFDRRSGRMNGTPKFSNFSMQNRWKKVMEREYADLCDAASSGRWTILRHYGAKNRREFFAVATEAFFETPIRLKHSHFELYDILLDFYNTDTALWLA